MAAEDDPVLHAHGVPVQAPDGRTLIGNAGLSLSAGQSVAVQGPSGSGKSTLLGMLTGLLPVPSGSVRLAGAELVGLSRHARAAHRMRAVGFVYQGGHLLQELSAVENVALPLRLLGVAPRPAGDRARASLEAVGLAGLSARHPSALSGGEAQRVAVARALVHQPPVVVADEPTGSLDEESSAAVVALLRAAAEGGAAVLVVTHDSRVAGAFGALLVVENERLCGAAASQAPPA